MPNRAQTGLVWTGPYAEQKKQAWDRLAKQLHKTPTELARQVCEEFMSCYMEVTDLERLGMIEFVAASPGLIKHSLRQHERRMSEGDSVSKPKGR